jgi:hypothetical protein
MGVSVSRSDPTDIAQTYIDRLYSVAENQNSDPPPFWLPWHQKLLSRGELRSNPTYMDGFWIIPNILMVGPQPNRKDAVTALVENHGVTTFVSVNPWTEYKMWYPLAAVEYNSDHNFPSRKETTFPPYWSVYPKRQQSYPSLETFANEERDINKELLSDPFNIRWIKDKEIEELRQIHTNGNTCEGSIVPYPGITEFYPQNTDPHVNETKTKDTIDFHFPITLNEHGTTQLSYPICDGACGDDVSMIQLAEHIALRILYAYPAARKNNQTYLLNSAVDHTVPTWEKTETNSSANNYHHTIEHKEDIQTHEVIYLHCHKGRGRAPTIAALVLVSLFGLEANEAIEYVQFCNWHRWSGSDCKVPQTEKQRGTIQRLASFVLRRSIPLGSSKLDHLGMDYHTTKTKKVTNETKSTKKRKTVQGSTYVKKTQHKRR